MAWTEPTIDNDAPDGFDYMHLNKIEANLAFLAGGRGATIAQQPHCLTGFYHL